MIKIESKGNFLKTEDFFKRIGKGDYYKGLKYFGEAGITALRDATPKDTGKTAQSWGYVIEKSKDKLTITWTNSNINKGVNIAIIIQYGHGMPSGYYVEGVDYINPALQPIFDLIAENVWKEVTK